MTLLQTYIRKIYRFIWKINIDFKFYVCNS